MSTILLCNKPIKADALASQCGINSSMIFGAQCRQPSILTAYTPTLLVQNHLMPQKAWLTS